MLHAAGVLLVLVFIGVLAAGAIPRRAGSLRWARFFFRGWVVLSLLWVALIVAVRWGSIVAPVPAPAAECGRPGEMACVTQDDALVALMRSSGQSRGWHWDQHAPRGSKLLNGS